MLYISSRSNEKIKHAVRLGESTAFRKESGEFFLEGARLCSDAAGSGIIIKEAFFTEAALRKYERYTALIAEKAGECFTVSPDAAGKLSATEAAQGVFCVCRMPERRDASASLDPAGRYIALENVQDPANLGAVCRTAEALGLSGLIVSGGCDVYNPKALRAAMGSSLRLNILMTDDLPSLLQNAAKAGMLTLASTPLATANKLGEKELTGGIICAVGNEGSGLSEQTMAAAAELVTIPMAGRAESLNASAAAAILMWEISGKGR